MKLKITKNEKIRDENDEPYFNHNQAEKKSVHVQVHIYLLLVIFDSETDINNINNRRRLSSYLRSLWSFNNRLKPGSRLCLEDTQEKHVTQL